MHPALILQHPSAKVIYMTDPPPETPASVAAAIEATREARAALPFPVKPSELPTDELMDLLAVQDGLFNAIQKYGADRMMRWVRNLAAIAGQEVSERPVDRCLADGAALINSICVRCGRDNS